MTDTISYYQKSADFLKEQFQDTPDIGIILGSGLQSLADQLENPKVIPYTDIPNFLVSTNKSHAGKMIFGKLAGKKIICMQGRFHSYEGYSMQQLSIPVRVLKLLGIKKLIVTNACGAVNTDYHPGDIMIIKDHIKLSLESPVSGQNIEEFGPRFFDVSKMYTPELIDLAEQCGKNSGLTIHKGVYMFFPGPQLSLIHI